MKPEQCRCKQCDKLLFERAHLEIHAQCPRCKTMNSFGEKKKVQIRRVK